MDGCKARNQPKSIYIYLTSVFFIDALSEATEKLTIRDLGARGRYRHNGLRINTAQDVTDITCQHMYVHNDLAKFKGLLIKKKVIKGFSAKLKVLKDCNQIKGF